jgi:hypothetical protein
MLIMRLEDEDGYGPWKNEAIYTVDLPTGRGEEAVHDMYNNDFYPTAWSRTEFNNDFFCGVRSVFQLQYWFSDTVLSQFAKLGIKLNLYEVPENHVQVIDYQVVFPKKAASLVRSILPHEYHIFEKDA